MTVPKVRKGQADWPLPHEEFEKRFRARFVDPAYAPGTGGPEVAGFTSVETVSFLRALTGLRLVGCDCVEVSPPYDSPGQLTAHMGANAIWELLALIAVAATPSQARSGE